MSVRSNCLIFALTAWLRPAPPGEETYLLVRRSRVRWGGIHALHGRLDPETGQVAVSSYKPNAAEKRGLAVVFKGREVEGDAP